MCHLYIYLFNILYFALAMSQKTRVEIPALLFTSFVLLDKCLALSVPVS